MTNNSANSDNIPADKLSMLEDFTSNILLSGNRWRSMAHDMLVEKGVDPNIALGLSCIAHVGDGAKQVDIASKMGLTAASLVRVIDSLEELALVERKVDETNRRANRIWLTTEGLNIVSTVREILNNVRDDIFRGSDLNEINNANNLLKTIIGKKV